MGAIDLVAVTEKPVMPVPLINAEIRIETIGKGVPGKGGSDLRPDQRLASSPDTHDWPAEHSRLEEAR